MGWGEHTNVHTKYRVSPVSQSHQLVKQSHMTFFGAKKYPNDFKSQTYDQLCSVIIFI